MKQFFLLGLLTLLFPFALSAQNITVSGKVFDSSTNEPLVGVTVVQTGTQNGTITDMDGNYSISCPGDASLTFSYIGYITNTVFVNGKTTLPVYLDTDDKTLDEIVVIGYGTQRKSDLTGSVASVGEDDMKNRSTSDAAAALQGKAAGVQVLTNSGAPGKGSEIRVRGVSSNSGSLGPLLIVDGLKVDNIQYLDPEMIESMEILKDAASAAIYGAQAGNGVVLITTKNGSKSKDGTIFYNGQWSLSSLSRDLDVMDAATYGRYCEEAEVGKYKENIGLWNGKEVKWQDEVFEPTWNSRHTLGFQGGNDRGSYYVALNHVKHNGIFVGDKDTYKRFSLQVNGDYKIKKWLTVGTNSSLEKWETKSVSQQSDNGSALLAAVTSDPLFGPLVDNNDQLTPGQLDAIKKGIDVIKNEDGIYYRVSPISGESQSSNPFIQRDKNESKSGGINFRGLAYLNFNPIEGLVYTSRFGYRVAQSNSHDYDWPYYANDFNKRETYRIAAAANTSYYYSWENFANYNKTFAEQHTIGLMAGMSFEKSYSDNVSGSSEAADVLTNTAPNFRYLDYVKADASKNFSNKPDEHANISYFGRVSYSFDNRYSIQANFRADAFDTSKLPHGSWGYFPSFSAGWTVSNESFIKDNISTDVLSFLKIRGSWGKNGNVNVLDNYPYVAVMSVSEDKFIKNDGTIVYTSVPNGMPNPDLTWETSEQIDLGFDARFLNSRLTIGLDWYKKTTRDLLVTVAPVVETGIGSTTINAGDVENKGLEIELGWKDKIGSDFHYSINANLATLKNEMTYLTPMVDDIRGAGLQGSDIYTRCAEGEPLWHFWGYKTNGLNPDGTVNYVDKNGDDVINADDKFNIGCGLPKVTYGFTLHADYKGIDFTLFATGVAGNKILPQAYRVDRPYCNNYSWFYDNAGSKFPSPAKGGWTKEVYSSDMTIFDGSYFKIKTIQLGYTLPKNVVSKVYISNMRVFASLENFFTFTKYIGLDPETASANSTNSLGIDMGTYPTAKQVVFGVNVTF